MATNPHIYVDSNHGTNDGSSDTSFASRQTGAMSSLPAAEVYENFGAATAATTDPSDGDFIYVADNHSASYDNGINVVFNVSGALDGVGLTVVSVDTTAIDAYKVGTAKETLTDTVDDFIFNGNGSLSGINLQTGDDIIALVTAEYWAFQDLTVYPQGTNDSGVYLNTSSTIHLINSGIDCGAAGVRPVKLNGTYTNLIWKGGTVTGTAPTIMFTLNDGIINVTGVDLSLISGTLVEYVGSANVPITARFNNCKMNAGVALYTGLTDPTWRFELYNSDSADYHRFEVASGLGQAINNDSIYVTATEGWYGGSDKSSISVTTTAKCLPGRPFVFELPSQYVDLASTSTDFITLDLITDTALTEKDICAYLVYPDGASAVTPNWVNSQGGVGGYDPLSSTALSTSSLGAGEWTGEGALTSPIYYKLELDTSGNAGSESAIGIRIEVYKASITDPIYIHPLLTLS
jgi:hypothetical protein